MSPTNTAMWTGWEEGVGGRSGRREEVSKKQASKQTNKQKGHATLTLTHSHSHTDTRKQTDFRNAELLWQERGNEEHKAKQQGWPEASR